MQLTDQQANVATIVASYWTISISMVYLNKILLSPDISIPAPLFITFYQCLITTLICYVCGTLSSRGGWYSQFPKPELNLSTARAVMPLSIVFVAMITFNNICLKYVEVSFYNVARSLTLVFNVVLSFLLLGSTSSQKTLSCLGVVVLGFFIGSAGEMHFSFAGTLSGILSSLFVSLNSIFTKKILPVVNDNHWRLTYYNNLNALALFTPLIIIFEREQLVENIDKMGAIFWSSMTLGGCLGFAIGIVTVLQIKATSPLTHNISGTAKAAFQSILAFWIWQNPATFKGVVGIACVLGGSLLYTVVKMRENEKKKELPVASERRQEMQPLRGQNP